MPQFTISEVTVDKVVKGKNSYSVANVVYTTGRGESKTKKIMSFSNPAVFATAQAAKPGEVYDVQYVPGDEYYNWQSMKIMGGEPAPQAAGAKPTSTAAKSVSTYETPEERRIKQLYIIKQSSIGHAIEFHKEFVGAGSDLDKILSTAQSFVDFVYGTDANIGGEKLEDMEDDIPY